MKFKALSVAPPTIPPGPPEIVFTVRIGTCGSVFFEANGRGLAYVDSTDGRLWIMSEGSQTGPLPVGLCSAATYRGIDIGNKATVGISR